MLELDLRTYADKTYRLHNLQPKASLPLQERCWLVQSGTVEINLLDSEGMLCSITPHPPLLNSVGAKRSALTKGRSTNWQEPK